MESMPNIPTEIAAAALGYEANGHKILVDAEKISNNPLSKATFKFLADQELKHMESIKAFAKSLEGVGSFSSQDFEGPLEMKTARSEIKGIFERFRADFEEAAAVETRLDIYDTALEMEHHGHDFYKAAAEKSSDETAREFYNFLVSEEDKHFQIIQDTRDYLEQPDAFMAVDERWMQF